MRPFDFAPLYRSSIGFDRLIDLLQAAKAPEPDNAGPAFDIERVGKDRYRLTLAVSGLRPDELSIVFEPNLLLVVGRQADKVERTYLYRGILPRGFQVKFDLADFVYVEGAAYENGLLKIDLRRELPEVLKPRPIPISTSAYKDAPRPEAPTGAARRQVQESPVKAEET